MAAVPDHSPLAPRHDRVNGGYRFLVPKGAGKSICYITEQTGGFDPMSIHTWIITATADFTVEVESPKPETYAAAPNILPSTAPVTSGHIAVLKGRWPSLKITSTGDVYAIALHDPMQYF